MAKKIEINTIENVFNQKKINHIFHYTDNFEYLIKIIKDGFAPSYCQEKINNVEYFIPMTSFCNIPLRDVDLYVRYGKYGIGMSLDWALKNSISPVVYIHETTPFKDLHFKINQIHLMSLTKKIFNNEIKQALENVEDEVDYSEYEKTIQEINNITLPTIQFFKNWKTMYKGKEIITYQEREWRLIPNLIDEKRLITIDDEEFNLLKKKKYRKKPHLPNYTQHISDIESIRYIMINNENQREKVLRVLNKKFGEENVITSILSGELMIIKDELIYNDF